MAQKTKILKGHPGIYLSDLACGLKYPSSRDMLIRARDLKVAFYTITLGITEAALQTSLRLKTEYMRRNQDA